MAMFSKPVSDSGKADVTPKIEPTVEPTDVERQARGVSSACQASSPLYYDMTKKKRIIIINHHYFHELNKKGQIYLTLRDGTDYDVARLEKTFRPFGFDVEIYNDFTRAKVLDVVETLTREDHSNTSCLFFFILTHGDREGTLYAADAPYNVREINNILAHRKFALIPRVMFLQACRGHGLDYGHHVKTDSTNPSVIHVPSFVDFLTIYSTVEGNVSYRDVEEGTWSVQSLCNIIEEHHSDVDLLQMTTLLTYRVAYDYTHVRCKQNIETVSSLTKFLKLTPVLPIYTATSLVQK